MNFQWSFQLLIHWPLLLAVDALTKIGSTPHPSELRRLYAENLALKAVNESLRKELHRAQDKRKPLSFVTRASQVFAYLLTRGNKLFQDAFLGSSPATIKKWATRFRRPWARRKNPGGRPPVDPKIVEWVIKLKKENPRWGAPKIVETLARMGIKVSQYTVYKILKDNGLDPTDDRRHAWEKWVGKVKDEYWAMDFFFTQLRKGTEFAVLIVVDTFTKEILELTAHEGRAGLSSNWVAWRIIEIFRRFKHRPQNLIHDRDPLFKGQVMRLCAVEEIKEMKSPPRYPTMNCYAERALQSVLMELLHHVRPETGADLQKLLDDYRVWFNEHRAHEALDGMTPAEYASGRRKADVVRLADYKDRNLRRIEFAGGMLNGYQVEADQKKAA